MNATRRSHSSRSSHEKEAPGLVIDYQQIGRLCLKYWKWLAVLVVLGAVAGLLTALSEMTIYQAKASIVVAPTATVHEGNDIIADNPMVASSGDSMMKTFEQLLQTRALIERVVRNEKLTENREFLPAHAPPPVSEDYAVAVLASHTTIRQRLGTRIIDITVEHHLPEVAKYLADKLAHESGLPGVGPDQFRGQH